MNDSTAVQWGDWPTRIGEYLIAFGALELATFDYLKFMERDEDRFCEILQKSFKARVDRINQLVNEASELTEEHKLALKAAWIRTVILNSLRLRLALYPSLLEPSPFADGFDAKAELLWNPHLIELHEPDFEAVNLMSIANLQESVEQVRSTAAELQKLIQLVG